MLIFAWNKEDPLVLNMELLDLDLLLIPNSVYEFTQTQTLFFSSVKYNMGKES